MHHHIVDRCADAGRKRPSIWIGEPFESRDSTVVTDELIGNLIQLEGRYTRLDMSCQFAKRLTNKLVGLAHQLNFIFSLQKYLHAELVGANPTASVDTSGVEQAVVVTHQQMTLNLLECVEHNTNKNQQ